MATTRIYYVEGRGEGPARLVKAISKAQAYGHLARAAFKLHVASQENLVGALSAGAKIEDATAEPIDAEEQQAPA